MGNVKEKIRQQINRAAANFLCDQPSGDLYDAYLELKDVQDEGHDWHVANDYVVVWQPLEYMTVKDLLEVIESAVTEPEEAPAFMQNMNWNDLKKQKASLLSAIMHAESTGNNEYCDDLTGILHLLDAIQDYAVDVMGLEENDVMDLTQED